MTERRLSLGGHVVRDSLAAVGLSEISKTTTLVETAMPRRRPYELVLAQNAWCVIGQREFRDLVVSYPSSISSRHRARRAVAWANLRRATHTMALSHSMGDMMARRGLRPAVSPVTLPIDYLSGEHTAMRPTWVESNRPMVVIPGSVTWYKNSEWVIDFVRQYRRTSSNVPLVVLAGGDDGSGCLQHIQANLGGAVLQGLVSRPEMRWLLTNAQAVVIASRLESLSFSLSEALLAAPHVVASPIEVHREIAARVGREPMWLNSPRAIDDVIDVIRSPGPPVVPATEPEPFVGEWKALADELGRFTVT